MKLCNNISLSLHYLKHISVHSLYHLLCMFLVSSFYIALVYCTNRLYVSLLNLNIKSTLGISCTLVFPLERKQMNYSNNVISSTGRNYRSYNVMWHGIGRTEVLYQCLYKAIAITEKKYYFSKVGQLTQDMW